MKILFKFATIFFVICLINVGFVCSIPTRRKIPAWTGKPFASDLTAQDKNVFESKLDRKDITLGNLISDKGSTGLVYSVKNYKSQSDPNLVAKILTNAERRITETYAEVKVLKLFGKIVTSGQIPESTFKSSQENKLHPVIIMQAKQGTHIQDTPQYKDLFYDGKKRTELMNHVIEKYCRKVAQVATEKGIYHYDLHPGNFLVTFVGSTLAVSSIELLDWGLATLVQKPVTKGEVYEYYKEDIRSLS